MFGFTVEKQTYGGSARSAQEFVRNRWRLICRDYEGKFVTAHSDGDGDFALVAHEEDASRERYIRCLDESVRSSVYRVAGRVPPQGTRDYP